MSQQVSVDVTIIGGGIAGLWLNAKLRQLGYSSLLIESNTLGGQQTVKSQGIIHGGTKYALSGVLTGASEAIAEMPPRWRDCLAGQGELDLSSVTVLAQHHYLWSPGDLAGNLMSFFASKALRSRVKSAKGTDLPLALQNEGFKGKAYQLNELVLDVPTVVERLLALAGHNALQAKEVKLLEKTDEKIVIQTENGLVIETQQLVFSAGEGNGDLVKAFNLTKPVMQIRPLHMVMVKSPAIKPLYAHCLGAGVKPRVTVTTHYHDDGTPVWYVGGDLAEANGVARTEAQQIEFAKKELESLLPWIDLTKAQWATLRINRAEPAQSSLMRPDSAFISEQPSIIVGWPTKLALAPDFSDQCIAVLKKRSIQPKYSQPEINAVAPSVAKTIWNELFV